MKAKHVGLAAALAFHAALFVLLSHNPRVAQRASPGAARPPLQVRLIPIAPPKALPAPLPAPPARAALRTQRRSAIRPAAEQPNLPPHEQTTTPITLPAAAASEPTVSLRDTDATRRAIRDAARTASIVDRAAQASDEPRKLAPDQRLGQEVARAARGDCLKGEYLGGGMGLLSLPFLVAAELRDKCRR
jgi:type IV secretory pathway VirB10-like protein